MIPIFDLRGPPKLREAVEEALRVGEVNAATVVVLACDGRANLEPVWPGRPMGVGVEYMIYK